MSEKIDMWGVRTNFKSTFRLDNSSLSIQFCDQSSFLASLYKPVVISFKNINLFLRGGYRENLPLQFIFSNLLFDVNSNVRDVLHSMRQGLVLEFFSNHKSFY